MTTELFLAIMKPQSPGTLRWLCEDMPTAKNESAWEPRRYWRGPVWIILHWFIIEGLQRYGYRELAEIIRQDTLGLIETAGFREYYDARDGSGCGSTEFSWSAALTLELSYTSPGILKS